MKKDEKEAPVKEAAPAAAAKKPAAKKSAAGKKSVKTAGKPAAKKPAAKAAKGMNRILHPLLHHPFRLYLVGNCHAAGIFRRHLGKPGSVNRPGNQGTQQHKTQKSTEGRSKHWENSAQRLRRSASSRSTIRP